MAGMQDPDRPMSELDLIITLESIAQGAHEILRWLKFQTIALIFFGVAIVLVNIIY